MKNKKLIAAVAAAALVAVIGVGATLAYFTDSDEAKNVLTLGAVDIELTEPNYKGDAEYVNIVPGDVIVKDPVITLASDSEDAYVRVKLEIDIKNQMLGKDENDKEIVLGETELENGIEADAIKDLMDGTDDTEGLSKQIQANGWYFNEEEGYYYFNEKLTQDSNKAIFFRQVNIPFDWDNDMADTIIRVNVYAEAIQADNYTPVTEIVNVDNTDIEMITSWTFMDGTPITGDYIENMKQVQTNLVDCPDVEEAI